MARPPANTFAGRTTRQSWADVASSAATYDRIVVPFGIGATVDTGSLVAAVARRLTPCGTAFVVVPGPALDPDRPDAGVIANLVHSALPHHRVHVESFGNPAVAAATDRPAAELGPLVDRHDPAVPVVLALTISPTRCAR